MQGCCKPKETKENQEVEMAEPFKVVHMLPQAIQKGTPRYRVCMLKSK
jgi:hypothetical protein